MRIVLIGAGGHGRVVLEALRSSSRHDVTGWIDPAPELAGLSIDGVPVLGADDQIEALGALATASAPIGFTVAVGVVRGGLRRRLFERAERAGLTPVSAIHATAIVAESASVSPGVAILAGAIVNTHAYIGQNAIVNSGAIVEHDVRVEAHAHVAPGAILCGGVILGAGAFLGAGSRVREGVSIGAGAVVGIGSVVLQDVPADILVFGAPARPPEKLG